MGQRLEGELSYRCPDRSRGSGIGLESGPTGWFLDTAGRTCVRLSARQHTPSNRYHNLGFRVGFQAVQPDTANPELELFGGASVTREAGQAWAEPGAAGHDARDGNLTASVTVTGTVDMNTTGTYILTYSVADAAGNTATANRTVTVVGNRSVDLNATVAMDMLWVPQAPLPWAVRLRKRAGNPIVKTSIMCPSPKGFTSANTR